MARSGMIRVSTDTFALTIDYTQSLAEMVAAGNYDHVDRDITDENFPVGEGVAEVEAILVDLDRPVRLDRSATTHIPTDALAEMDRRELRPATMVELLAFGAQYPDQQREFSIAALGSVWAYPSGDRNVGCLWGLWGGSGRRGLNLRWYNGGWGGDCRFLAFPK